MLRRTTRKTRDRAVQRCELTHGHKARLTSANQVTTYYWEDGGISEIVKGVHWLKLGSGRAIQMTDAELGMVQGLIAIAREFDKTS